VALRRYAHSETRSVVVGVVVERLQENTNLDLSPGDSSTELEQIVLDQRPREGLEGLIVVAQVLGNELGSHQKKRTTGLEPATLGLGSQPGNGDGRRLAATNASNHAG